MASAQGPGLREMRRWGQANSLAAVMGGPTKTWSADMACQTWWLLGPIEITLASFFSRAKAT